MSKYRVLGHPNSHDTSLYDDEFDDIDTAVRWAIELTCSHDFLIVKVINWSVVTTAVEED